MKSLLGLVVIYTFLFPPPIWSSDIPGLQSSEDASSIVSGPAAKDYSLKPEVAVTLGSTSNAALTTEGTAGLYARVSPRLGGEYSPSEALSMTGTIGGQLKRFSDPVVGLLANETLADLKADIAWLLGDQWEVGSNLSAGYTDNRLPVVGPQSVESQVQRYYQPDLRLYGTWIGEALSLEVGSAGTTRRYATPTTDILGNAYNGTYNEYRFDGKLAYRWSKELRLSIKSTLERRSYAERAAEFSEGLPNAPGTSAPLLITVAQETEVQLKYPISTLQMSSSASFRAEQDEVYGARDSTRVRIRQKALIPLPFSLSFEPEVSLSRQGYANFRADPIDDARNSPLRLDWDGHLLGAIHIPIKERIKLQAQYAYNRKLSNYSIQSYSESVFETAMNVQF